MSLAKPRFIALAAFGDLLFFGRPISHVGIYLGGGRMVHAPRSGSRVKVTTSLNMGRKALVGASRY